MGLLVLFSSNEYAENSICHDPNSTIDDFVRCILALSICRSKTVIAIISNMAVDSGTMEEEGEGSDVAPTGPGVSFKFERSKMKCQMVFYGPRTMAAVVKTSPATLKLNEGVGRGRVCHMWPKIMRWFKFRAGIVQTRHIRICPAVKLASRDGARAELDVFF